MKILLIGEYSRLHNSLKEGLIALGMDVTIVGSGDDFKRFPIDIYLKEKYNKGVFLLLKKIIYRLTSIDITSLAIKKQFNKNKELLTGFDIVQLINENPFNTIPKIEKTLLDFIFMNNKNVYLLSCGTDYISVRYAFDQKFKYSIYTPYKEKKISTANYWHVIKWRTHSYKKLHNYIFNNIKGVISSDLDYHLPLINHEKYIGMIPNPINTQKLEYANSILKEKLIIFHGINSRNYYKKGNDIFDAALQKIKEKHAEQIEVIETRSLPYTDYIKAYNNSHILLDQVYAYDQGYNALEAMAKGKVVFTGAEQEWLDYYNLDADTVAINATPNAEEIAKKLEWLITNPEKITEISKNARAFIEKEHNYITIAKKYLALWEAN